jgi:dTDP-4-dehydrorhamnose 3,5-epimerase-like enzyme
MIHQIKAQYFPICQNFEHHLRVLKTSAEVIELYSPFWNIERSVRIIENHFKQSLRNNLKESIA